MATRRSGVRRLVPDLTGSVRRAALVVGFTGVETAALAAWLGLVRDAPPASATAAAGLALLFVGLFVEHYLTSRAVDGPAASFPALRVGVLSASEAALWALWLTVAERVGGAAGFVAAAVVLAVLLVPQHTLEDGVLRGEGLLSGVADVGTLGFSVIEAAGSTAWLVFVLRGEATLPLLRELGLAGVDPAAVGVAVLAGTLLVEHVVGVAYARRE